MIFGHCMNNGFGNYNMQNANAVPVGNPLARNRPHPTGLIPLREDGDEEAREEESLRGMVRI